jgi:hypothetical protein
LQDRALRSLARLQNSAATSRVLNLHQLHRRHGAREEHRDRPLFRSRVLNKGLIVKHRLRGAESDLFDDYRTTATKLILPIDGGDLRSGGRYLFVGQRGYEAVLAGVIGEGVDAMLDRKTLEVLSQLPSFDPFLMREHLRRFDIDPAPSYFDISAGDLKRMLAFLQSELRELVELSVNPGRSDLAGSTASLAQKLLSNTAVEEMDPLRVTLRLERDDYLEGVFCWKGFLYYKWRLGELKLGVPVLVRQIRSALVVGQAEPQVREYIRDARVRIIQSIVAATRTVEETLAVYDQAYSRLTAGGDPTAFRDFLLQAPGLFVRLGETVGVIDHIASFWTYRFPPDRPISASAIEMMDIFLDFEEGLGLVGRSTDVKWASAAEPLMLAG